MQIEQAVFIEEGDFTYRISFLYKGHNLVTDSLPRSMPPEQVRTAVEAACHQFDAQRADDNFEAVRQMVAESLVSGG